MKTKIGKNLVSIFIESKRLYFKRTFIINLSIELSEKHLIAAFDLDFVNFNSSIIASQCIGKVLSIKIFFK